MTAQAPVDGAGEPNLAAAAAEATAAIVSTMQGLNPEKRPGADLSDADPAVKRSRFSDHPQPLEDSIGAGGASATSNELQIPQQFVGWLKGRSGAQIREIEARSGAQISIDQNTKEMGYSRVVLTGAPKAVQMASDTITEELRRVMERDGITKEASQQQASAPGEESAEAFIPQKYVGWLKGSNGSQVREMEARTGARVRIDQSARESGFSVAQISGPADAVRQCKQFIENEVIRAQERDKVVMEHTTRLSDKAPGYNEVQVPQQYVGWIKGSGGAQMKDIEARTGACITIDQGTQTMGFSRALIYGPDESIVAAKQIIQNELARVMDRDRHPGAPMHSAPTHQGSAMQQPLQQLLSGLGQAVGGSGGNPAAQDALSLVSGLLGAAGALVSQAQQPAPQPQQPQQPPAAASNPLMEALGMLTGGGGAFGAGGCGSPGAASNSAIVPAETQGYNSAMMPQSQATDDGSWDMVRIPNSCVGWLKGRQGAMMRDIEARSGCQVDIDQTTKHMGFSVARMRGMYLQKKTACGFVIAEVMKVLDQSGEQPELGFSGHKWEFRVDTQYVGWVKGPQGKVVQDIQMKSSTRIDVHQNTRELGYATVKVFGTHEGVKIARALIATTLAKITPELATSIVGDFPGGYEAAQQIARQAALASLDAQNSQMSAMTQMPDTMDQTAAMASLMAGQQQQLTDMMGMGGFGQQMDASMLNGFDAATQAAFMQQQSMMQNNFGCGFSPLPDPNAANPGFPALPDANATNPGFSALPDPSATNPGFSALPDPNATNPGFPALPDPSATNIGMQQMGDAAFGQPPVAQPETFGMQAQPPVDLGAQFPPSHPQTPPPSLPPTQPVMQQPDQTVAPAPQQQSQSAGAAAAMQLVNSLQQLANAVQQAATQNRLG